MDLLAFDTFSEVCSVGWLNEGPSTACSIRKTTEPRSHASKLAMFADELIRLSGKQLKGVVLIAGPGSYTGLRIGASTAKGIAWSLDIPLFAVSTLHYIGMCAQGLEEADLVMVATLARADEVFMAQFVIDGGLLVRTAPDKPMPLEDFESVLQNKDAPVKLVSSDDKLLNNLSSNAAASCIGVQPDLTCLVTYLANQLENFRVQDLNSFEPAYLKDFVARKAAKSIFEKLQF